MVGPRVAGEAMMKKTQSVLMKAHSLQRDRHIDRQSQWNVTGANTDVLREGDGGGLLGHLVMPEPSPKVSETSLEKKREAVQAVATHTGSRLGGTRQKTGRSARTGWVAMSRRAVCGGRGLLLWLTRSNHRVLTWRVM